MTRLEAISILHGIRADNLNLDDLYTKDKYDALGMAIKALEGIEKIWAEVESINVWALRYAPSEDKDIRPQIVTRVKSHVLEIIDKYKAGSES